MAEESINTIMQDALKNVQGSFEISDSKQDITEYRNNAYNVVSIFGFLIGVPKEMFDAADNPAMMMPFHLF